MIKDYINNNTDMFLKYSSIFTFIFFFADMLILVITPSANQYELSIYGAYPLFFWILMILCIILSVINIIVSVSFNSMYGRCGLLCILLCYSFLLFLPIIRGYEFFGQPAYDLFTHLALIYEIINTGHLSGQLYYPTTHLLAVILYYSGMPLKFATSFISVIFVMIYLVFLYLLGKVFFKNNSNALLLLAFGLPLMFSYLHYAFIPYLFALLLIPFFLYCLHKKDLKNRVPYRILTLILAFFIVFTHPLVTLFLLVFLILYYSCFHVNQKYAFSTFDNNQIILTDRFTIIQILTVSFLTWYLSFHNILRMFSRVVDALFDQEQSTIMSSHMDIVKSSTSILDLTEIFIKVYGSIIIYLFLAFFCFLLILNKLQSKSLKFLDILYGFQFLASVLLGLLMISGYFIVSELIRAFSYAVVVSTIFCGIIFGELHEDMNYKKGKKWISFFAAIIICFSSVMGIFNLYESPWKNQISPEMNSMMIDGLDWFLINNNESVPLASDFASFNKYESYHSQYYNKTHNNLEYTVMSNIPSHFGYDINNTLLASLGNNANYMIIHEYMIQKYKYIPKSQQFNNSVYSKNDFQKLNSDSTANKLYMNGEFELWNVPIYNNKS